MDSYEYRKTKNIVKIHSENFQSVLKNQIKKKPYKQNNLPVYMWQFII